MADALGCDRSNYGLYERGVRSLPPRFVAQMRARWGVTFDFLYAGAETGLPRDLAEKLREQP